MDDEMCWSCNGRGYHEETRTVPDVGNSIIFGAATGIGYFPMSRTETIRKTCFYCNGTGRVVERRGH